jgi:two-component system, NarL family, nitrate/nitrite response regulator NarL
LSPHARGATIRVLVASDLRLYREGLAASLAADERVDFVATAASASEALAVAEEHCPQVVLLATEMNAALEYVRPLAIGGARVLALAVRDDEEDVVACAEAGVAGYITRDASLEDVVAAVETAACGEAPCSPRIVASLLDRLAANAAAPPVARPNPLTYREREIVALIDEGLSNKQIAGRLTIGLSTVKNHVHHILEKLQIERRTDVAAAVRRHQF